MVEPFLSLTFRAARPADAAVAAPLIHSSGPDAFEYVFSSRRPLESREFLEDAFARGLGRFGWTNHTVGCVDGQVVGIGAAYGAESNGRFFVQDAAAIARFFGARLGGAVIRGLRTERVMPPPRRGEWMLAHIAVDAAQRGHGVGARLVRELLNGGVRPGARVAVLDVSVENPRAEALYRRMGFATQVERVSSLSSRHGRVANHRRMTLELTPRQ